MMNLDKLLFGMMMGFFGMAVGASLGEAIGKIMVLQISLYWWILLFIALVIRAAYVSLNEIKRRRER